MLCPLAGVHRGCCTWTFGVDALAPALPQPVLFPIPLEDTTWLQAEPEAASAGGHPCGICLGLGCPWPGPVPWQFLLTQSPQEKVIHLPRRRHQPWEETDPAQVTPWLTKESPRERISLLPWLPPKGLPRSLAVVGPPSLCLFPAWGSTFLPQSATGLGQRVSGHLPAGPALEDRVGPATLLQNVAGWWVRCGWEGDPGMLHPLGSGRAVVGAGAQPGCLHPQLEDCTLQVSPSGHYLDLDLSLLEQKDDLEGFYEEVR